MSADIKPYSISNFDQLFQYEPTEHLLTNAHKILHFFRENSKEVYLLDLDNFATHGATNFKKINLNIDFKIPKKHISTITPHGQIFLMGGAEPEYDTNKLNKTYQLDEAGSTLIRKTPFGFARVSAGCLFFQGHIYLIGGKTTNEGYTNKCEKYNVKFDKWVAVASMNSNASSPMVCSFNDKEIYKFGGVLKKGLLNEMIEKYNPVNDKWTIVPFKGNVVGGAVINMGYQGHCLQVSPHEILIFGSSSENKPADSFVMGFEEDQDGGKQNKWKSSKIKEKFKLVDLNFQFAGERYGDTFFFKNRILSLRSLPKDPFKKILQFSSQWDLL
jgi:hypothetical protein